jgi:hypothetical protein
MARPAPYSLTDGELINKILNPDKADGFYFKPLPEELQQDPNDSTKMLLRDSNAYLQRFLETPEGENYKGFLRSQKPNDTSAGDIAYYNMYADSWLQAASEGKAEAPDFIAIGADYLVKDLMTGQIEEEMPYISQADYQNKISEGLSPEEIWPQLTDPKHITARDRTSHELNTRAVIGNEFGKKFYDPNYLESKKAFPSVKAQSKINDRNEWYKRGGEITEDGVWIDKDGNTPDWFSSMFRYDDTEFNTREQYEARRLQKRPFFSDGVLAGLQQNIAYEWFDPAAEGMMAEMFEQKAELMKDPQFMEVQEWNRANPWTTDTNKWSWDGFGKKMTNLLTGTVPSYATAIGAGITTQMVFRNPVLSTSVSSILMGALDSSDMFTEAYEYALSQGMTEHDAKMMAYQHYETYMVASIAWESVPFSRLFRRVKPDKLARKSIIRNISDGKFKNFVKNVQEEIINVGPVAGSKLRAMASQGMAEALTELGQYSTQVGIEAGYKDKDFMDIFDVQEALDAVFGGLLMGGVTGGVAGGRMKEEQTKPKATTPVTTPQQTLAEPKGQQLLPQDTQNIEDTGVPVSYPKDLNEYLDLIADSDKNDTALNVDLITTGKQLGKQFKSPLGKAILKQGNDSYETQPIKKIFDIMLNKDLNPKGDLSFIDNSNLDDATKEDIKKRLMVEYKAVMGRPFQKKNLTPKELEKKNAIDNLSVDEMIEQANQGGLPTVDKMLDKKVEVEAKKQEQENLQGKTFDQLEKEGQVKTGGKVKLDVKDTPKIKKPKQDKLARQIQDAEMLVQTYENQIKKAKTPQAKQKIQKKLDNVLNRLNNLRGKAPTEEVKIDTKEDVPANVDVAKIAAKVTALGNQKDIEKQFEAAEKEQQVDKKEDVKEEPKEKRKLDDETLETAARIVSIMQSSDPEGNLKKIVKPGMEQTAINDMKSMLTNDFIKKDMGNMLEAAIEMLGGAVTEVDSKKKEAPKKVESKPEPTITIDLGSEIESDISDIVGDVNVNEIGDVESGTSLTEEQSNKIEEEADESVDELLKTNCIKGNE